jgi:hypothetical protein
VCVCVCVCVCVFVISLILFLKAVETILAFLRVAGVDVARAACEAVQSFVPYMDQLYRHYVYLVFRIIKVGFVFFFPPSSSCC